MSRERNLVSGRLMLRTEKSGMLGSRVTYETFYMQLDFWQKILKCSYDYNFLERSNARENLLTGKGIPFVEIMKADYDQLDQTEEVQFRAKFNLYTKEFNFELHVKTSKERDFWIESFCRAIESKHRNVVTNWAEDSKLYTETRKAWALRKDKVSQQKLLR